METLQKQQEVKSVTPNQESLYWKLLQSSRLKKSERDEICLLIGSRHMTTKDASVLIDYLILRLRFIRHFNLKSNHSVAACSDCGEKTGLKRYINIKTKEKFWLCSLCGVMKDVSEFVEVYRRNKHEN